jgi:nucleoside-diphosphate-sugar epimerase
VLFVETRMKILVAGGTGLIGSPTVRKLLERGHSVRLLSRHAEEEVAEYEGDVEAFNGSITDPESLEGAADGCDAVIHIAGIVQEKLPDSTFQSVNVDGTYNLMRKAECAEVKRFVYVSSLGADTGESDYHKSKLMAEAHVQRFQGDWVIVRPGNVFGPGDNVVSLYIQMVRTLPAVPVIDNGDQPAQPIWAGDLAEALVRCVERENLAGQVLEVGGREIVTAAQMLDRIARLTGKSPTRIPIPGWAAQMGTQMAEAAGVTLPFSQDQITMLTEGNVIKPGERNALIDLLHIEPTPLDEALKQLLETQPEMSPSKEGVGQLHFQEYEVQIANSGLTALQLFDRVKENPARMFDGTIADAEGGSKLELGENLTLSLPLRGDVQVRVVDEQETQATCLTVEGHPLAGAVVFEAMEAESTLVFRVRTYDKPATALDAAAVETAGRPAQGAMWQALLANVVEISGGKQVGQLYEERRYLDEVELGPIDQWLDELYAAWQNDPQNQARLL